MEASALARLIEQFLADAPNAVVLEEGQVQFELPDARIQVSADRGKCLLHLWSDERNTVRRVVEAEQREGVLRLAVQRFGQAKPHKLEVCRDRDRRSAAARKTARAQYERRLERVLLGAFPEYNVGKLSSTMDLERSFSPVYARGLLRRGRSALAVLGVGESESQPSMDAALTFALLWLDHCREREAARCVVEGLKLFVPAGHAATVRARMAHLDHAIARFELYELNEKEESISQLEVGDVGNIHTRLVQAPNQAAARDRFAEQIARVTAIAPDAQVVVVSGVEVAFRLHGLEFARARMTTEPGSLRSSAQLVYGACGVEQPVTAENGDVFTNGLRELMKVRHPLGDRSERFFRVAPERWLESLLARDVTVLDPWLDPAHVYSQVPAFSASDRAMIDVLAATRDGRLAVLELKADEDIHLALQGLDYWARVQWHHARGEFQQFGYFPGAALAPELPLLWLIAPAMHVHPATDKLLRFLSPRVDWSLIGLDERWREGIRVVFRKRRQRAMPA